MTFLNFTVPDASPLINYSDGQWVEGSPTNDSFAADYSNGSFKVTFDADSAATFTFKRRNEHNNLWVRDIPMKNPAVNAVPDRIFDFSSKRPNHGNYSVSLDDGPAFVGNGTSSNLFQFPLWNAQNLPNTQHTAVMTNLPTSQGKFLDIDFISIGRELGPPGFTGSISNVMLDDESPFITYNPPSSWSPIFSSDAFNSSLHQTTDEGASVSLSFQGSSIELYGLYVNAPFQVHLNNQLPRNLAGPNVDLNSQQEHPQTLLYLADGLNESETNVVTLINSVANSGRPLYFDFAIVRSSQEFFKDTPSPNPNFTISQTASGPSATTTANKNTTISAGFSPQQTSSTGAIVGGVIGGVAGVIILAFIGFILFRRSKYYHGPSSRPNNENGRTSILPVSNPPSQFRSSTVTPFILPTMPPMSDTTSSSSNATTTLTKLSLSQQSHSPPPTLAVPSSERLSLSQASSSPTAETFENQVPFTIGRSTNQSRGNTLISQTYVLQEQDAGRLVQTSLPPMYNADWQDAVPS